MPTSTSTLALPRGHGSRCPARRGRSLGGNRVPEPRPRPRPRPPRPQVSPKFSSDRAVRPALRPVTQQWCSAAANGRRRGPAARANGGGGQSRGPAGPGRTAPPAARPSPAPAPPPSYPTQSSAAAAAPPCGPCWDLCLPAARGRRALQPAAGTGTLGPPSLAVSPPAPAASNPGGGPRPARHATVKPSPRPPPAGRHWARGGGLLRPRSGRARWEGRGGTGGRPGSRRCPGAQPRRGAEAVTLPSDVGPPNFT